MKTSYKKLLNRNQLILSDFDIDGFDESYLLKMLTRNNIPGLLRCELSLLNSLPSLCYDISSKHSLVSFTENKKLTYPLLSSILSGLNALYDEFKRFMLDSSHLLLSPEYIFLNPELMTPYFCYCPIQEKSNEYSFTAQLKLLLDYAITKLDYNDRNCVAVVYSLHRKCVTNSIDMSSLDADMLYGMQNKQMHNAAPVAHNSLHASSSSEIYDISQDFNSGASVDVPRNSSSAAPFDTQFSIPRLSAPDALADVFPSSAVYSNADSDKLKNAVDNNTARRQGLQAVSLPHIMGVPLSVLGLFLLSAVIALSTVLAGLYLYLLKETISFQLFLLISLSGPCIFLLSLPYFISKRKYYAYMNGDISSADKAIHRDSDGLLPDNDRYYDTESIPSAAAMPIGDTVLIGYEPAVPKPRLLYNENGSSLEVSIDSFPFTVGKIPDSADYIIDSNMVSRIHARFYRKEDSYYVEDLNSSNGTYVNGALLPPQTMTEIKDGDSVTFAHLTYTFKL